ncbi:acyltransferase [Snodgrassella sp. ESL0253]|uniref:acyltransferase family protein n=1 Tax=Snodgrassella sp. ESL0253 TaxID=2705031 RepID=UPI0015815136|nr:acyltransferase [Snodgrassella sp. ESL0253]NUE66128.1 acyltransferase [Snodgrassella sp. ESL0253]
MLESYQMFGWILGLLLLCWAVFSSRLFVFMDNPGSRRIERLDGLRFLLAFSVAMHHYVYSYYYLHGQSWTPAVFAHNPLNLRMGVFGVTLFFMLSGYLFAQSSPASWLHFYLKRFLRIAPIFYLSSCCCVLLALYLQRHTLVSRDMLLNLYYWFDAGITGVKPPLFGMRDARLINAGVAWTLYWEWAFYFSLPLLCFVRQKTGQLPLAISVLFIAVYCVAPFNQPKAYFIACFAVGALARIVSESIQIPKKLCDSAIVLLLVLIFSITTGRYHINFLPLFALLFILIALGGDIFGLLRLKAFVRLGDASYSIYLLHGIGWFCLNKVIQLTAINLNKAEYTLLATVVLIDLMLICTLTYRFIEQPFMQLGRSKRHI